MNNKSDKYEKKAQYDFIEQSISKKLESQLNSLNSLDTKANIFLVALGALLAGYLTIYANNPHRFADYKVLVLLELISFFGSGYYIFKVVLLYSWPARRKEKWRDDPNPKKLLSLFAKNYKRGEYWLKDKVIRSMAVAYQHNERLIEKKYDNFRAAKALLSLGVIALVVHILLSLYNVEHMNVLLRR